ncbi:hypothetical protein [Legionella sainthelensi]|uniref:hypothetical protein n=1 Tax=Legionella sainthelensi TaxID=28087 RepID=UPI00135C8F9F|nr:hypothetical protein [Legionella sainthelensi]
MSHISILGINSANNVFQSLGVHEHEEGVFRKKVGWPSLSKYYKQNSLQESNGCL